MCCSCQLFCLMSFLKKYKIKSNVQSSMDWNLRDVSIPQYDVMWTFIRGALTIIGLLLNKWSNEKAMVFETFDVFTLFFPSMPYKSIF